MLDFIKQFMLNHINDLDSSFHDITHESNIIENCNIMDDLDYQDSRSNEEYSSELDSENNKKNEDLVNTENDNFFNYIIGIIGSILGYRSNDGDSSQEAEESLSKEYKETVRNASDDDDDPSSTLGPIDREEAKAKISNTITIKDCLKAIIALLYRGGDSGGDSSPGILSQGIWSLVNSVITELLNIYTYVDCIPSWLHDYIPIWLQYTVIGCLTIFDYIPSWVSYTLTWGLLIVRVTKFIYSITKSYRFDLRWMTTPQLTLFNTPLNNKYGKPFHRMIEWIPPHYYRWAIKLDKSYGRNHLKNIMSSLGLLFIRANGILPSYMSKTYHGDGCRTITGINTFLVSLVRLSTRIWDPICNKYNFYFFHMLIYFGVGVIIWYQIIPAAGDVASPVPTGFDAGLLPEFRDPSSIVEGYRKVTYLFTKDITPIIIHNYQNDFLFRDLYDFNFEDETFTAQDLVSKQSFLSVGLAIMMAAFITTKTIYLPA